MATPRGASYSSLLLRLNAATAAHLVVALVLLLTQGVRVLGNKGLRTFNADGEDVTTVDRVELLVPTPDFIHVISTEGDIFNLRRRFDVVALLVLQEYDCAQCSEAHQQFVAAAEAALRDDSGVVPVVGAAIAFAVIDAEEQADEFAAVMADNPDFHWFVPSIFIFKAEHQFHRRWPPLMFVVNENVERDLPKLLLRLVGEDIPSVREERELFARITSPATDGVSFGFWGAVVPPALRRIAEQERLNILFHHLLPPPTLAEGGTAADAEGWARLVAAFNPEKAAFVAYRVPAGSSGISREALKGSASPTYDVLLRFIERMKTLRPGHEYDLVRRFHIAARYTPAACNATATRRTRAGDRVVASIVGRSLEANTVFLTDQSAVVVVGDAASRPDIPPAVVTHALGGLCRGHVIDVVLPAGRAYRRETEFPPLLPLEHRALLRVELLRWADEGEVEETVDDLG